MLTEQEIDAMCEAEYFGREYAGIVVDGNQHL